MPPLLLIARRNVEIAFGAPTRRPALTIAVCVSIVFSGPCQYQSPGACQWKMAHCGYEDELKGQKTRHTRNARKEYDCHETKTV
uniref:Secreted protein n=1 Tax=Mycena chlorophos TaxID=658473 RepID=A0ABQ0LMS3_MYCCL|nr:predicted protein [Mycena chlorophos]